MGNIVLSNRSVLSNQSVLSNLIILNFLIIPNFPSILNIIQYYFPSVSDRWFNSEALCASRS
jgi:hypothetical protein